MSFLLDAKESVSCYVGKSGKGYEDASLPEVKCDENVNQCKKISGPSKSFITFTVPLLSQKKTQDIDIHLVEINSDNLNLFLGETIEHSCAPPGFAEATCNYLGESPADGYICICTGSLCNGSAKLTTGLGITIIASIFSTKFAFFTA